MWSSVFPWKPIASMLFLSIEKRTHISFTACATLWTYASWIILKSEIFKISSVTGEGVKELLDYVSKTLKVLPKEDLIEIEEIQKVYTLEEKEEFTINREDGIWVVNGPGVERIMRRVNLEDNESMHYFHKSLDKLGVNQALKKAGVKDGDTVSIDGWELEWYD